VIADARIDQDGVLRRLDQEALYTKNEPLGCGIDECRLEPGAVLLNLLLAQLGEELQKIEKRTLLLDDGVNRDVLKRNRHGLSQYGMNAPPTVSAASAYVKYLGDARRWKLDSRLQEVSVSEVPQGHNPARRFSAQILWQENGVVGCAPRMAGVGG
jgi:hypothetical protein